MAGRKETQKMLNLTCAMWDDEKVLCYQDAEGSTWNQDSIFLAGPSSREDVLEFKWRSLAVHYLREAGFIGIIFKLLNFLFTCNSFKDGISYKQGLHHVAQKFIIIKE